MTNGEYGQIDNLKIQRPIGKETRFRITTLAVSGQSSFTIDEILKEVKVKN